MIFGSARGTNPEAGDHAVSADPREQAAAEAAIRASWREFPYYPKRYGERGWRFSLSDTGWLQTLIHVSFIEARAQVWWLAGLLAARGMPTLLLERHLQFLHQELLKAIAENAGRYTALEHCAAWLRKRRLTRIPEARFNALAQDFEQRVRGRTAHVANMGVVVVAAAADEFSGVAGAVGSFESWACDPVRFDAEWIAAVRDTLTAARAVPDPAPLSQSVTTAMATQAANPTAAVTPTPAIEPSASRDSTPRP